MILTVLQVALGGAIGSSLRFLAGVWVLRLFGAGFPLGVLAVNIVGSFAIGLFAVYAQQRGAGHLSPFVMAGVLGGFTTFSAFSLEAYTLFERGHLAAAALYVGLSVVVSIAALVAGVWIARGIWA